MSKANKIKLIVFSLLLFSGILLNAQTAHAFFDVPFAIMGTQLDALDFIDSTLLRYMTFLAFLLVQGIVLILISANFLEWAITYPIGLGPDNLLVNKGWEITSHLTNMFFILIFVAIAIAYILKLETFGMKKALPKLIIMALLTNFSLLFTKMIVDIGWGTQNAFFNIFFGGNQAFATTALKPLTDNLSKILGFLTTDLAWFVGFALIPGLNVAKEAFLALWFFTMGGWGMISEAVVFTAFALSAGFIFLAYALFFLFRVAVVWILAILAPLAFAAYILPATEKFFKQWLHALIQWVFFGVAAFFLLGLGISLFGFISTRPVSISFIGTQPWTLPGELAKFLFLLVYLVVAFAVARKTAPIGADALWNFGGMATSKVGNWSRSKGLELSGKTLEWGRGKLPEGVRKWGEKEAMVPTRGGIFGAPFYATRRRIGMTLGPGFIEKQRSLIDEAEKKITGQSVAKQLSAFRSARTDHERIGILNAIIKDKNIDDALDRRKFTNAIGEAEVQGLFSPAMRYNKEGSLRVAFPEMARLNLPAGVPATAPPTGMSQAQHASQHIFDRIKTTDYENTSRRILTDNEFLEALILRGTGGHISKFIDKFGIDGADAIKRRIQSLAGTANPRMWVASRNPALNNYISRGAGQGLIDI